MFPVENTEDAEIVHVPAFSAVKKRVSAGQCPSAERPGKAGFYQRHSRRMIAIEKRLMRQPYLTPSSKRKMPRIWLSSR